MRFQSDVFALKSLKICFRAGQRQRKDVSECPPVPFIVTINPTSLPMITKPKGAVWKEAAFTQRQSETQRGMLGMSGQEKRNLPFYLLS